MRKLSTYGWMMTVLSALTLTACDTPVSDEDHDDHEAVGAQVQDLDGNVIATFENDVWTFTSGAALQLQPGEELAVRIFFIADDGDLFQLPHSGADYTLNVDIANTAVVTYSAHADHGDFTALTEGSTTAEIEVFHGSHPDWWTSPGMPIEVSAPPIS